MLEKARRYIASAEALRERRDLDSAISRLYYAMFYCAEALLRARGHSFSSHRAVISAFAQQLVKPGILPKELHQWLHTAFEKRQVGDYEFLTLVDESEVLDLASQAGRFLTMTEELLKAEGHL
jgi:uncharacterized protein (UPF0332 family)